MKFRNLAGTALIGESGLLLNSVSLALGITVLFLSAQLTLPWSPVPLTFQAATVIFLALMLPRTTCLQIIAGYLFLGALGAPVFAGFSGGIPVLFSPRGGYLLGFLPAAALTHFIIQSLPRNFFSCFLAALLGSSVLFATGFLQLHWFMPLIKAYQVGIKPFLLIEPIKLFFVALLASRVKKES